MNRLLSILILMLLVGCASKPTHPLYQKYPQEYEMPRIRVIIDKPEVVQRMYEQKSGRKDNIKAWFDFEDYTAYVPPSGKLDRWGRPLPDFESLGHEGWHGTTGYWHVQPGEEEAFPNYEEIFK